MTWTYRAIIVVLGVDDSLLDPAAAPPLSAVIVAAVDLAVGTCHCPASSLANDPLLVCGVVLDSRLAALLALGLELGVGLDLNFNVAVSLRSNVDLAVTCAVAVGLGLGIVRPALALALGPIPVGRWT